MACELAEQVRVACSQSRGLVVDFVDRVSLDSLDFVYSDLNNCERTLPSALDDIGISNKKMCSYFRTCLSIYSILSQF